LVIGVGKRYHKLPDEVLQYFRERHIAVDVMSTPNATSTFNILNQEGRVVGGAMLPEWDDDE
jgi:NADH dehydrogenase [ubiquinone] 1 alpha subcomplex assembly factor 3